MHPGQQLRAALKEEVPLQIAGTINAYCALLAQRAGFRAIYLSGAGVANASFGIPDLGITRLSDVAEDARRISRVTELPLLVDADTGWEDPGKTAAALDEAGAAGMHLEDQVDAKRCGHRPGKRLVSVEEMEQRLRAAVAGRASSDFVIMARTDAHAVEGLDQAIFRARRYVAAGADMIFAEALTTAEEFQQFCGAVSVPVLANMTEFGKTPLFHRDQLRTMGVRLVLYPLSAFRAMNLAAQLVYQVIRNTGTQQNELRHMQTRQQLYDVLDYLRYEDDPDAIAELVRRMGK